MSDDHITEVIPAFLNGELTQTEKKLVAEHLIRCEPCRKDHDEERLGTLLAARLTTADAPDLIWSNIVDSLDKRSGLHLGIMPKVPWFDLRKAFAIAAAITIVSLTALIYLSLYTSGRPQVAVIQNGSATSAPSGAPRPLAANEVPDALNGANIRDPQNTNAGNKTPDVSLETGIPEAIPAWQVEVITGAPKVEGGSTGKLAVGKFLETDGRSQARITVADIGTVDVSPNSRVRLARTGSEEHRLALERGRLHAKIFAPPRLFVVDTPSAKAVDLGCEYTLEVDDQGNSILNVTGGWVALERGGRESIVPAGMMCKTKKGIGLGTPFSPDATEGFRKALDNFDFSGGGAAAVRTIVREADFYDMFTLWHLLSRVRKDDRGLIYDTLAGLVKPPAGVTREGVLSLDRKMLDAWKAEVETAWFN